MTDAGATAPDPYVAPSAPPPYTRAPAVHHPGRAAGIVGFVLAFFFILDIAGLIVSIVGLVQSRKAGLGNGFAVAGIIISIVGILVGGGIAAVAVPLLVHAGQECAQLGNGTHVIGNTTYTCTPTSFNETTTN
jgi:hypothetical protein